MQSVEGEIKKSFEIINNLIKNYESYLPRKKLLPKKEREAFLSAYASLKYARDNLVDASNFIERFQIDRFIKARRGEDLTDYV